MPRISFWRRLFCWSSVRYEIWRLSMRYAEARVQSVLSSQQSETDDDRKKAHIASCEAYGELYDALEGGA